MRRPGDRGSGRSSRKLYGDNDGAIPPVFRRLLVNTLVTGVTSSLLWFALTAAIAAISMTSRLGEATAG